MKRVLGVALIGLCVLGPTACLTNSAPPKDEKEKPPKITKNIPLNEALEAAIEFGGSTLADVKTLIDERGVEKKAAALVGDALASQTAEYANHSLINATHLYLATADQADPRVFRKLVYSGRSMANRLGWEIAAAKPSAKVKDAVEERLTEALKEGDEESVLYAEMAKALVTNEIEASYTFARKGLMEKGEVEFAKAMIAMDPEKASQDFLDYLALAPAEELRQLTLASVDLYSAMLILRHMKNVPPPVSHPAFSHLFLYSVSRNNSLAQLGREVLQRYIPEEAGHLAYLLSTHEVWVQMAYLENARRNMNPKTSILLGKFKGVASNESVLKEIDNVRR